ncbi:MAG: CsgG/HfaB family protein [bacterium]
MIKKNVLFLIVFVFVCVFQFQSLAKEKPRIAVVAFNYESTKIGKGFASNLVVDRLAADLVATGRFDVLERLQIEEVIKEQNFPQILKGEGYDYQKLGKLLGAQTIVTGTVFYGERSVTRQTGGDSAPTQLMLGLIFPPLLFLPPAEPKSYSVNVGSYSVAVKAIDVSTGKIVASEDLVESDLGYLSSMTKRLYVKLLNAYPVEGSVLALENGQVYVDIGEDLGISPNDIFAVYRASHSIVKDGIELLSLPEEKIGELEVKMVSDASSICKIIPHLTSSSINEDDVVKLIPVETLEFHELVRRFPKEKTRPSALGGAFVGQATGLEAVKYNPAGLAQVTDAEISLGWTLHSNSASFNMPNAGESYSGDKELYSSYVENPLYPSEFNGVMPLRKAGVGLSLNVDNMRINHDVFQFDDGSLNLGLYSGRAIAPTIMVGGGLNLSNRWVGIHRVVSSVDNSYQFSGTAIGLKGGFLVKPNPKVGLGGVLNLSTNYAGNLKTTGSSPSTSPFEFAGPSNVVFGLSFQPFDRMICNLDVQNYFNPVWYNARLGMEYSIFDWMDLRFGAYNKNIRIPDFANDPNYPSNSDLRSSVITGGLGYTKDDLFIDLTGEYETLKDPNTIVFPDFTAGSQTRTLLSSYKEARIKINIGSKF